MNDLVKNNIDTTKNKRTTNLLTALDKAFDELNYTTNWTALGPKEVQYNCCSTCIFGSSEFDNKDNRITYNIQDLDRYRETYRENRKRYKWYGRDDHNGEFLYLQHSGTSLSNYDKVIDVLNKHGISVYWNWSKDNKIRVCLDKFVAENNWEE